jgi:hypothetical protein
MPVYDAFISYSHAKDKPIPAALQSVICRGEPRDPYPPCRNRRGQQ